MAKGIIIRPEACIHCQSCALVCSYGKFGAYALQSAAVHVCELADETFAVPLMCMHCDDPACVAVCPTGALRKNTSGTVLLDQRKCILCGLCAASCALGNIHLDRLHKRMVKCDLCGGSPKCADICPAGAIAYVELEENPLSSPSDKPA